MGRKKKYINIFGSFTEPFNYAYGIVVQCNNCLFHQVWHCWQYWSEASTNKVAWIRYRSGA